MSDATIDGVLLRLDHIIEDCHRQGSRLGFFPAMYRKTTAEVRRGLETGRFEDPDRLERLDVVFAERYFEAYEKHQQGLRPTGAWHYAFTMSASPRPRVLQHLLLGMNAHINLDLGISAVEVAPGPDLIRLKRDFDEINGILGTLVDDFQDDLSHVFPLLRTLDFLCLRLDELAVQLAVRQARASAWDKATRLAALSSRDAWTGEIERFDRETVARAQTICPLELSEADDGDDCEIRPGDRATVRRVIEALVD